MEFDENWKVMEINQVKQFQFSLVYCKDIVKLFQLKVDKDVVIN